MVHDMSLPCMDKSSLPLVASTYLSPQCMQLSTCKASKAYLVYIKNKPFYLRFSISGYSRAYNNLIEVTKLVTYLYRESKCKTPTIVSMRNEERLFGESAYTTVRIFSTYI